METASAPNVSKVYRASSRIASEHKNCNLCRERVRAGMPVQFANGHAVHASCVVGLGDRAAEVIAVRCKR